MDDSWSIRRDGVAPGLRWKLATGLAWLVGVGLLGPCWSGAVLSAQPPIESTADGAAGVDETVADLADLLRRPGPEAAAERERAVVALMRRTEPEAHVALRRFVVDPSPDRPGDAAALTLRQLTLALGESGHPVLGSQADRQAACTAWTAALARLFVPADAAAAQGLSRPVDAQVLQPSAVDFLRRLDLGVRRRVLEGLGAAEGRGTEAVAVWQLGDASPADGARLELRRAVCRLAGDSRDVTLAPWLAERLDDPVVAAAASAALGRLTFVDREPESAAEFLTWWEDHRGATYLELAERAARRSQTELRAARAAAEAQVLGLRGELVRALLAADAPDWAMLQLQLLADAPAGNLAAQLLVLCDVLRERLAADELEFQGVLQDRVRLAGVLQERYAGDVTVAARPLLLEAIAYLAPLRVPEQRSALFERLAAGLQSSDVSLQRAALRGLRRLRGADARGRVVEVAQRAVDERDDETLATALGTLQVVAGAAPGEGDIDRQAWVSLLQSLLGPGTNVPVAQREAATELAVMRDAAGAPVAEAFELLVAVVGNPLAPQALRKRAQILSLSQADDPVSAERYLQAVLQLAADDDAALRSYGLSVLHQLPSVELGVGSGLRARVIGVLGNAIAAETDARCVQAALAAVLRLTEDETAPRDDVQEQLISLAAQLAEAGTVDSLSAERRAALIDALRVLGLDPRTTPAGLLQLADALAVLRAGAPLEGLLRRLTGTEELPPSQRLLQARLQLRSGELLGVAADGPAAEGAAATAVVAAADTILATGEVLRPVEQVVHVEALGRLGRHAEVLVRVGSALESAAADPALQERLLAVATAARLARGERDQLEELLQAAPWPVTDPARTEARLTLWGELLQARLAAEEHGPLLAAVPELLTRSADWPARWRELFLLGVAARLALDQDRRGVAAELRRHEERFTAEGVPEAERARYAELLRRAAGGG